MEDFSLLKWTHCLEMVARLDTREAGHFYLAKEAKMKRLSLVIGTVFAMLGASINEFLGWSG